MRGLDDKLQHEDGRWLLGRLVLGLLIVNLIVAAVGAGSLAEASDHPLERVVATTTTTTTTTTAPVEVAPAELSEPTRPRGSYSYEPVVEIGTIQVPALGLDWPLYQGTALSTINYGPSHWPGTALPGHVGNTVVAGHRVTYTHPFRHMDILGPGDIAILTTAEGVFTYEYVATDVVTPDRVDITDQTQAYTATFFACHPPGSARYRIVTHWRLISAPAPGQPDPKTLPPA